MSTEAAAGAAGPGRAEAGGDAVRRYAPLAVIFVALAIVLAVLPSALNLPQSNPTQTLEYAPVPPDDQSNDAVQGNLGALGLGASAGVKGGGARGGSGPGGTGALPVESPPTPDEAEYRCVGKPPRQTEDPLSPPCVPFFDGDNFGHTYQGVSEKEIRLLVYLDGGVSYISGSNTANQVAPTNEYHDLFKPPDPQKGDHLTVASLRVWQKYFNLRFQRYKRVVHFYVFFSSARGSDARRADAADNFAKVNPFAVISLATEGFEDEYLKAMAAKGVLNFGSFSSRPASLFQRFPKMVWGYLPSVEQQAESYTTYLCQKVVNKDSVLAGPLLNNQKRKLGMIFTDDPKHEGLINFGRLVVNKVEECGGKVELFARFHPCCVAQNGGGNPGDATTSM
ncbi:MAG TPA: hypothetical protein VGO92_09425, partial [Acidimicrobiales bacterium]|nr:hypothetical protein [Acidimicrobiales bacterium]